jgi:hypothetical protein
MYGYWEDDIYTLNQDTTNHCLYCKYQFQCPFCYQYRQKIEEYPIEQSAPPKTPPPSTTPKLSDVPEPNLTAVEYGAIAPCIFRFTYIWLRNGQSFWTYLVFISRTTISGWQYKAGQWVYFSVSLKDLKNFICTA